MRIKLIFLFAFGLLATVAVGFISWKFYFKGIHEIKKLSINAVDIAKVADGVHSGQFQTPYKTYEVKVVVKHHDITGIDIHPGDDYWSYFDRMADAIKLVVLREQKTDVDVIGGATVTSKAILKAIENALTGGLKQVG